MKFNNQIFRPKRPNARGWLMCDFRVVCDYVLAYIYLYSTLYVEDVVVADRQQSGLVVLIVCHLKWECTT